MRKKYLPFVHIFLFIFIGILYIFGCTGRIDASSIGLSPGSIKNEYLLPGSHMEQEFVISRKEPISDDNISVEINTNGFDSWIKVDPGNNFILPEGEQNVSMIVSIDVPENAEFMYYDGSFKIVVQRENEGQVTLQQGIQANLNLKVIDEDVEEFEVRNMKIEDFSKWSPLVLKMEVENKGNIKAALDEIMINILDTDGNLIKEISTTDIPEIEPFTKEHISVSFEDPGIDVGSYSGEIFVYHNDDLIAESKSIFSVTAGDPLLKYDKEDQSTKKSFDVKEFLITWGLPIVVIVVIFSIFFLYVKKSLQDEREK